MTDDGWELEICMLQSTMSWDDLEIAIEKEKNKKTTPTTITTTTARSVSNVRSRGCISACSSSQLRFGDPCISTFFLSISSSYFLLSFFQSCVSVSCDQLFCRGPRALLQFVVRGAASLFLTSDSVLDLPMQASLLSQLFFSFSFFFAAFRLTLA